MKVPLLSHIATALNQPARPAVPFHQFLCKIHTLCNLDCSYCYVYHHADQSWRHKPKLMSWDVVHSLCEKIREHVLAHAIPDVEILLHGGEPTLAGPNYIDLFATTMRSRLGDVTKISFGMQSNGTLISPAMIEVLKRHQISTGISLDGPKQINDLGRKDHAAQSTYDRAAEGIRQLQINRLLGGILCTIQLEADPLEIYSHLKSYAPRMLEFNLSLGSYDNPPPGKIAQAHSDTAYADWLIPIFDAWYAEKPMQTSIRFFHDIMTLLLGAKSSVETLGLGPVDIIAIETNGAIEAVDTMKIVGEGAPELQLNVFESSFDDALLHPKVQMRQATVKSLCITCQECPISAICGGGYFPTRYSSSNGFNNPSVFCTDLYKLITHIRQRMLDTFSETGIGLAARELPPDPPLKLHHESA